MSLDRKITSSLAWMSAGSWIEQAVNFAVFAILARLLGVEAFGLVAMAAAFVLISEFLVRESISEVLLTSDEPTNDRLNSVFWLLAGFGTALTLILVLSAGPVGWFYDSPQIEPLLLALSPTVLMIALTAVPVAILRRKMQFRILALRAVAGVIVGGMVGIGMALAGYGVWSLAGQRLAQVGTNIVMAWAAVAWRPARMPAFDHIKQVMRFSGQVVGLRAAEFLGLQLPAIIVGATLGPVQVGYYTVAWRVVEIASFLIATPLRMVSQPAFNLTTRSGGVASILLLDIMRLSGLVIFPAFAGLAVLSEPVLVLLFGEKWAPATPVLGILSVLGIYLCIEKVQQSFCLAAGRIGRLSALAWAEVFLATVLVILVSSLGLTAVTAAFVASYLLIWILRFRNIALIADVPIGQVAGVHLIPALLALVMGVSVFLSLRILEPMSTVSQVMFGTLGGALIYLGLAAIALRDRLRSLFLFLDRDASIKTEPPSS